MPPSDPADTGLAGLTASSVLLRELLAPAAPPAIARILARLDRLRAADTDTPADGGSDG